MSVALSPIQSGSGDPAPDNVRPISGRTGTSVKTEGKNLVFKKIDGTLISSTGVIVANSSYNMYVAEVKSGEVYAASVTDDYEVMAFYNTEPSLGSQSYDENRIVTQLSAQVEDNSFTFTAPISGYVAFRSVSTATAVQLERGSQASAYVPYIEPHTVTLSFGQTVYGGTVNFKTGLVTIDKAYVFYDGSNDEAWVVNGTFYEVVLPSAAVRCLDGGFLTTNRLRTVQIDAESTNIGAWVVGNSKIRIRFDTDADPTETKCKTWLASNNLQAVYELATPTTLSLTPAQLTMLKDYNYLSGDGVITITAYAINEEVGA